MQDFSPLGNLINSFLKHQASRAASNIVVGANNTASALSQSQNLPKPSLQQQILQQAATINTQHALTQMESTERAVLIKELLNLPSNLKDLLATLQTTKTNTQAVTIQSMENINIEQLMQLMQTNGKEALSKLMQLGAMLNKYGNVDNKQLQELQFIINACMPNSTVSNTQFMKNLILLYLPWLPIGENNNFDIDFSSSDEKAGEEGSDDTITILIQTENYGNVKVLLILEAANKINMIINCAKLFPKELLQSKLKESSKEFKLETTLSINENETVQKGDLDKTQKVHMSGASVLNPYILLMAHAVIRHVIEIDKSQSLVSARKKVLK